MSTIIDGCCRGGRFIGAALVALAGWFALAAMATLALEPSRTVGVLAPLSSSLAAVAHADARLVDARAGVVVIQGDRKGFVRQLYAGGAWLVLPAGARMLADVGLSPLLKGAPPWLGPGLLAVPIVVWILAAYDAAACAAGRRR